MHLVQPSAPDADPRRPPPAALGPADKNYPEAAAELGISVRTLRRLVTSGAAPHYRYGVGPPHTNRVRFSQSHIDQIRAASEVRPVAWPKRRLKGKRS